MTAPYRRDEVQLSNEWQFLPFRFHRFPQDRVLLTNLVGEHMFLPTDDFERLATGSLPDDPGTVSRLRGKHLLRAPDEQLPTELLALKMRTRYRRLADFTALHIFVVTLRCEHACHYCQVSRQNSGSSEYDMSPATATRALEATFMSPSEAVKIEFQGGEPLLNFPLVKDIVTEAERMNQAYRKQLSFVMASNLALLDNAVLEFAAEHNIYFSTSLDGPEDLHNANRARPGRNSWQLAIEGIQRIRSTLGEDRVSALMTTTEASLSRGREIVDCYLEQGFNNVFLRPISPYGFAIRTRSHAAYDATGWLAFYEDGLNYILELNYSGVDIVEQFAAIALKKILTNEDPGYVDLMSPAGIGIGAIVYNYDADVYASDEGRMLAEMGDKTFRLGNLHRDRYADMITSDRLLDPLEESFALSAPMCTDCAFECYCGADPVFHYATTGDFVGRKPDSPFCTRNMGVFKMLLERYETDPRARDVFQSWASR